MEAFLSYAHEDEWAKDALLKHAAALRRSGQITIWHDREILPGRSIDQSIDQAIERSGLILFLIGPDFIDSDYCMGREMKRALELYEQGAVAVVPVICRPCDWEGIEELNDLMALPTDAKPINTWKNQDEAWNVVIKGLRRIIQTRNSTTSDPTPPMPVPNVVPVNRQKNRRVRARRKFTEKDRDNFKKEAFESFKEYFQRHIGAFGSHRIIQGEIRFDKEWSFCCTIYNQILLTNITHITIRMGTGHMKNWAIYWSFEKHAPEGSMNDAYIIESNESGLCLRLSSSTHSESPGQLNPEQAAESLWLKFIEKARADKF